MRLSIMSLALVIAAGLFSPAFAHDYRLGNMHIVHPWARATSALARNGAAYMSISNEGDEVDSLIGVATPAAKKASLHTLVMENDIMKMLPVKAIEVHPGTPSVLKPGGLHVMLMRLTAPLEEGTTIPLTLTFEKAGSIEVEVVVQGPGSMAPQGSGHGDHDPMVN